MIKRKLIFIGLLSLGVIAVSGCAEKMAKSDGASPPATAQPAPAAGDTQAAATEGMPSAAETPSGATQPAPVTEAAAAAPEPSAADKAAAAALLPLPPQEIAGTIKKLTTHPRVRYLSRSGQYSYFVGGVIDAEYDLNNNQLVITNASDSDAVTCQYSKDGELISDKKKVTAQTVAACNKLINDLSTYLSR